MKNKKYLIYLMMQIISFSIMNASGQTAKPEKKENYVPNKETAIKIAEAVWLPIYGNKIYKELPFKATLINDSIWAVGGTLNKSSGKIVVGGTAYIELQKSDGKILKVTHGK
jgi:NTF2 fold immunity protein